MHTRVDLVEFSLYWIAVALALPPLDSLSDHRPTLAIALAILVFLPAPLWIARLWVLIPERVETLMFWHSTIFWAVLGIALAIAVGFAIAARLA